MLINAGFKTAAMICGGSSRNTPHHAAQKGESKARHRQQFESQLRQKGFLVQTEISPDAKQLHFVKIHTPFSLLCDMAEHTRMRKPLKVTHASQCNPS